MPQVGNSMDAEDSVLFKKIFLDSIFVEHLKDVNFYIYMYNKFVLYKSSESRITDMDVERLLRNGIRYLFVRSSDFDNYNQGLEGSLKAVLSDDKYDSMQRGRIVYQTSINYINEVFSEPREINQEKVSRSKMLIENILKLSLSLKETVEAISNLVVHNYYEYTHGVYVASVAVALTNKMYTIDKDELVDVGTGCLLHDIGKINIPNEILSKPGKLTKEEMEIVRRHPIDGYEMLKLRGGLDDNVLEMTRCHHEKFDGTGYPYGLKGDQLGRQARVGAICDVFCALISKRSYRQKLTNLEAIRIMEEEMKGSFDPELLKSFKEIVLDEVGL